MEHLYVKKRNGRLEPLNTDKINRCVVRACEGLENVSASEIVLDAHVQLYNKVTTAEIDKALILSARSKIEKEPNYSYAAARILVNTIYKEVFGEGVDHDGFELQYKKAFIVNLKKLAKADRIDNKLLDFDLKKLADSLVINRDQKFKYLGLQTLYDRYFIHLEGRHMETPQAFWMRVAMGLSVNEINKEEAAIKFYTVFSEFLYCPSTPTLFNAGTCHPQLSSCYLSTVDDSIDGIFRLMHSQARLSKFAGGLGVDFTPLRATGSYIKGTNGNSQGLIPWIKIFDDTLVAVNQGGKRKGAGAAYLETWHLDIEDFIELRKNTGDHRRRTPDTNLANWIPDLFMQRVEGDSNWTLFSPSDVPDLHEIFGKAFNKRYAEYEAMTVSGEIKNFRTIKAKVLWKKILTMLFETGMGWPTFKDPSNIRYSNQHIGVVHNSNLCTEILLHTIPSTYSEGEITRVGETAVCNLGSINLPAHCKNGKLDYEQLGSTVRTAIRALDNVVDINYYPTSEAKTANLNNRPVGLGIMGFHDLLHELGINIESLDAQNLSSDIQEQISYQAILTSSELAKERGAYPNYKGSLWDKGKLPLDTWVDLLVERDDARFKTPPGSPYRSILDWNPVRVSIGAYGMRNSNTMAIAPTATISYIVGCSQSTEPDFSVLWVYSTLSGEFTMINEYFVRKAKKLGIWNANLIDALKRADGDISLLDVPQELKDEFKTAFQVDQHKLIDCAALRQIWIDMGQSLNLYANHTSLKALNDMYFHAWRSGLKTTYYLRTTSASKVEKSSVSAKEEKSSEELACSIEAMRSGTVCEACQ
jgi:ribonucleoside-diphosphate reductase alpha chain